LPYIVEQAVIQLSRSNFLRLLHSDGRVFRKSGFFQFPTGPFLGSSSSFLSIRNCQHRKSIRQNDCRLERVKYRAVFYSSDEETHGPLGRCDHADRHSGAGSLTSAALVTTRPPGVPCALGVFKEDRRFIKLTLKRGCMSPVACRQFGDLMEPTYTLFPVSLKGIMLNGQGLLCFLDRRLEALHG